MFLNVVVFLGGEQYILYGNKKGVYWSEPERKLAPVRVLSLPDVSQIDVLEDHNLLICLSGTQVLHLRSLGLITMSFSRSAHRVTTIPLNMLSLTSRKDITSCTIVSSHVSLFKIGTQSNRKFVCIVKAGSNSVFKMMEPNFRPSRGSSELRQYKVRPHVLAISSTDKYVLGILHSRTSHIRPFPQKDDSGGNKQPWV